MTDGPRDLPSSGQAHRGQNLTLCLGLWSDGVLDLLTQGKVLDEGETKEDRRVGLCPLPEVELYCTALQQ